VPFFLRCRPLESTELVDRDGLRMYVRYVVLDDAVSGAPKAPDRGREDDDRDVNRPPLPDLTQD